MYDYAVFNNVTVIVNDKLTRVDIGGELTIDTNSFPFLWRGCEFQWQLFNKLDEAFTLALIEYILTISDAYSDKEMRVPTGIRRILSGSNSLTTSDSLGDSEGN